MGETTTCASGVFYIYIYIYYIYILYIYHTDHHHTVQVARVQVQYLRQWVDEKAPPVQVAEGEPQCVQVDSNISVISVLYVYVFILAVQLLITKSH